MYPVSITLNTTSTQIAANQYTVVPIFYDHPWDQENVVLDCSGLKINVI